MRYVLVLVFACISLCYTYGTVNAESGRFPYNKGGFNVKSATTWGDRIFTGNVFFVDSGDGNASDDKSHGMKRAPYATMDFADGLCTANNGDIVIALPGHVETVIAAAGLDLNTAGVTWRGVGHGSARPTIRFTTATTADMNIDGANITMINFLFEARVEGLAQMIDINAADCELFNIETRDIDAIGSCTNFIVTDANADRLLIDGYRHIGTATAGDSPHPYSAISLTGGDDIIIRNFNIYGNFLGSGIIATTTDCTRVNIYNGQVWTENATDSAISVRASTGWVGPNVLAMLQDNAANITEAFFGGSMQFFSPLKIVNLAGEQATDSNITFSTD